ncbi:Carnitine O-palmitoyltransferase 1, liver isoform [Geodia barretti]|uniref:Carnitine O-palmitoyltransferase 1, liver isoform n=1 Tax=Geodia barretti TaxID=519541 RepID=A0AA35SVV2_GEOBA|nr:Carnitine O-palmitoyltransferase 1, liver isoform [Geodia barretti]
MLPYSFQCFNSHVLFLYFSHSHSLIPVPILPFYVPIFPFQFLFPCLLSHSPMFLFPYFHSHSPMIWYWNRTMEQIMEDSDAELRPGEEHLAALTAADRKSWAEMREKYFMTGVNRTSMEILEKAAFMIMFDDLEPSLYVENGDNTALTQYCKSLFHGNGYTRWFDKSVSVIIYKNGKLGINAEHCWADAPIVGYNLEHSCTLEHTIGYRGDGHNKGEVQYSVKPRRLEWDLPPEAVSRIEVELATAQASIANLDLYVLHHDMFGKGVIKRMGISPDGFIQMALQLAYYKDTGGSFCLTYEASMTMLFLEGRTETVRPVTVESTTFIRAMCNPDSDDKERKQLLQKAVDKHSLLYKLAMAGKGMDRHLFCLYVISKYLKIESPFLAKVLGEPWRLSTSQTPAQQTGKLDYNNNPELISPGGGFGPVTEKGYGVSYIIQGDYHIYFHVSSFKSALNTDSARFANLIKESMSDMRELFLDSLQK